MISLLTSMACFCISQHMESINEKYKNLDGIAADAKERTDDKILLGYIDLLAQYVRALIEENANLQQVISDLKEMMARDASKKFGQSSERLKDAAKKKDGGAESAGLPPEGGDATAAGPSSASPEASPETLEARRKKQAELRAQLKELDREDAGLRSRQAASAQSGMQDCKTVDSTVPEEERFCRKCGAPLKHLRWREARRLALARIRLIRLKVRIERLYCPECANKARMQRRLKTLGRIPAEAGGGGGSGKSAASVDGGQPVPAGHGSGCTCQNCGGSTQAGENGGNGAAGTAGSGPEASSTASACTCQNCVSVPASTS